MIGNMLPALLLTLQTLQTTPCTSPAHRAFDFWIGDWDIVAVGASEPSAHAVVESILGGCVLRERYEDATGLRGESFSSYDPSHGEWQQTWVTNRGQLLVIHGQRQGRDLVFAGAVKTAIGEDRVRATWAPIGDTVRETAGISSDGGSTWTPWFDLIFRKRGEPMTMTPTASDTDTLRALNDDYIRSVQQGDVQRFREILADDFSASLGDGRVVDKASFLEVTARPITIKNLQANDVQIRVLGDVAVIHATTTFMAADGRAMSGRYTDIWARRGGRWVAIAAHVTRN
jgi:ketosteroid isomerase-like protein